MYLQALPYPCLIEALIKRGFALEDRDWDGDNFPTLNRRNAPIYFSLLHKAAIEGYSDTCALLVEHGLNVDALDRLVCQVVRAM